MPALKKVTLTNCRLNVGSVLDRTEKYNTPALIFFGNVTNKQR
jgi:hypothetical protein